MEGLRLHSNPKVAPIFRSYPAPVREKLYFLRELILAVARENEETTALEETLRWGEPSYLTKHGSTIRLGLQKNRPTHYAIYFNCSSRLIPTFKVIFKDLFTFEGHRAIVFHKDSPLPTQALKSCIRTALTYHKIKQMPFLGL